MPDFITVDEINGQVTNSESNIVSNLGSSESNIKQVINSSKQNIINNFEETYEVYSPNIGENFDTPFVIKVDSETRSTEFIDFGSFTADKSAYYIFMFYLNEYARIQILVNGSIISNNPSDALIQMNKGDVATIQFRSIYGGKGYQAQVSAAVFRIPYLDTATWNNGNTNGITFIPQKSGQVLLNVFPYSSYSTGNITVKGTNISLARNGSGSSYSYMYPYYSVIDVYKGIPITITKEVGNTSFILSYVTKTNKNIKNIKSIQRGNVSNGAGTTNLTIGTINPQKTICLLDGEKPGALSVWRLNENALEIHNSSNSINPISWQLIEFW